MTKMTLRKRRLVTGDPANAILSQLSLITEAYFACLYAVEGPFCDYVRGAHSSLKALVEFAVERPNVVVELHVDFPALAKGLVDLKRAVDSALKLRATKITVTKESNQ